MHRKVPPFNIKGPAEDDFKKKLTEVAYLAGEHGMQQLVAAGKTAKDIEGDQQTARQFIADCHRGFSRAQAQIGVCVTELEELRGDANLKLKLARRNRDKETEKELLEWIEVIGNRQLLFRRVADSIYYLMLNRQGHHYKRLLSQRRLPNIDPKTLVPVLEYVEERNKEEPLQFTLAADLTTAAHMTDLIELDRSNGNHSLSFIEMKSGPVNKMLLEVLMKPLTMETLQRVDAMGALDQLERMMRQHQRISDAKKIITTDHGFDSLNQMPISLNEKAIEVDGFLDEVIQVCRDAAKEGVSLCAIDECIRLVAIRNDGILNITNGVVAHYFYHLIPGKGECFIAQGDDSAREEISRVAQTPMFLDLVKFNLSNLTGPGLFALVPTPIALSLALGELRLFAQFDFAAFFQHAEAKGIKLTWASQKESADLIKQKLSAVLPGATNSSAAIHYQAKNGFKGTLFYGFFIRPFREFLRTNDLIEFIKERAVRADEENEQDAH